MADVQIKQATRNDLDIIRMMLAFLAHHEGRMGEFTVTAEHLAAMYFGENSIYTGYIVFLEAHPIAFVSTTDAYASFAGEKLLVLQELVIKPAYRGRGLGKALMAYLARQARAQGYAALKWLVLNSNESAMRFYAGIGASRMEGMSDFMLAGDAYANLAAYDLEHPPELTGGRHGSRQSATTEMAC